MESSFEVVKIVIVLITDSWSHMTCFSWKKIVGFFVTTLFNNEIASELVSIVVDSSRLTSNR